MSVANPLQSVHESAEAEFQPYGDIPIVSTFGEPQAEYAVLHKSAGLMDFPQRGILQVTGPDRIDFLNRFLTNALIDKESRTALPAGRGVYAFLLNVKGRIISDMNVLQREEQTFLETDRRNIPALQAALQKFVFSAKVKFQTDPGHLIGVHGPRAAELLTRLGVAILPTEILASLQTPVLGDPAMIFRDDPAGVPGYFLLLSPESARKVWMELISQFGVTPPRLLRAVGWAAFNSARIEAGRPFFGIDFDDNTLPAETSQEHRAVNHAKGCYLGQEVVARMFARKVVARQIVGLRISDGALPIAPTQIFDAQQNQIGALTSSTLSPILSNAAIGLAMLKTSHATLGNTVHVPAEGKIRPATVVPVPFIKEPA